MKTYGSTAKALHWLVVLLLLMQFIVSVLMPDIGPRTEPGTLINLHLSFGVLILVLMALRFSQRLARPVPLDMPGSPAWERRAAAATQRAFYAILLVGPFLGWASASAHGLPVHVFGIVSLPDLAPAKTRWAHVAGDIHAYLMWTLLVLIALHAAAALYHHFVHHDGVLLRVWPGGDTRGKP